MREIRGSDRSDRQHVTSRECQALFGFWRATVMGHHGSTRRLPGNVGGYFFADTGDGRRRHRPLGEVRRTLLALLDRTELTDDERTVIRLYYGLDGLPLPYASKSSPDIAGGRDESSPRGTCRAGIAKVARCVTPRPLSGDIRRRRTVDPLSEPWFRSQVRPDERGGVVARAWVRAMAQCDGPHGPPTVDALRRWYEVSGVADPILRPEEATATTDRHRRRNRRPNSNARHRAAALMEIALYEEVRSFTGLARVRVPQLPVPNPGPPELNRLPETVTHPLLLALTTEDLSPDELVAAAAVLQDLAVNGVDVSGSTALLLRCLRPRIHDMTGLRLERLAVSVSYVAATQGNPFIALEWLGVFLSRVGVTDRTFTVMVNTMEAAALGGYHRLAAETDQLFDRLSSAWDIPPHQIPFVERFEAEQQRLAARAFRLDHLGRHQLRRDDVGRAVVSLQRSVDEACRSARMAERVLSDRSTFPTIALDGKAGEHGGDLTSTWLLAAAACIVEPLDRLHALAGDQSNGDAAARTGGVDRSSGAGLRSSLPIDITGVAAAARVAHSALRDYDGPLDCNRFRGWHDQVGAVTGRVLATVD